jgi:hypothetical protein
MYTNTHAQTLNIHASERAKTVHALDRSATVTGKAVIYPKNTAATTTTTTTTTTAASTSTTELLL